MIWNNRVKKKMNSKLTYYVRLADKINLNIEIFLGYIYLAVSSSDYIASNDGMINELIGKDMEGSGRSII
jgi:hypothetical protein